MSTTAEQLAVEQIREAVNNSIAATAKLQAETLKIQRETYWYPVIAMGAVLSVLLVIVQLLGRYAT